IFAKTSKALSRLNESIRHKKAVKQYLAWVEGCPPEKEGILEHFLVHDDFKATVVKDEAAGGKRCRLHYRILQKKGDTTLLEIDLETGRYHQIRAQLAAIGCPILGDRKYGSKHPYLPDAIALHHAKMSFPHPISGELITITDLQEYF